MLPNYRCRRRNKRPGLRACAGAAALKKSAVGSTPFLGGAGFHAIATGAAALEKEAANVKPASTLVMNELPQPRVTHIMLRGNFRKLGEEVKPAVPAETAAAAGGGPVNRLGLASGSGPQQSADGARDYESHVPHYFGNRHRDYQRRLRHPGRTADAFRIARLVSREVDEAPMGRKGDAQTYCYVGDISASVESVGGFGEMRSIQSAVCSRPAFPHGRGNGGATMLSPLAVCSLGKIGGPSVFPYQPDGVWLAPL